VHEEEQHQPIVRIARPARANQSFRALQANLEQTDPLYRSLDATIARVAVEAKARFADTFPTFNPQGSLAREKARICALTFACSRRYRGDPHPTDAGYRAIAVAVWTASGYPRKP
jgi:hypothetical protein